MNTAARALRLGFAGTPHFALPALDALAQSAHRVVAVLTQPDRPAGRGQGLTMSPVKQRGRELGIVVQQPETLKSDAALALLRELDLDALVVVAYGLILPPRVLAVPRLGCFNIHASLLPRWRGAAPIQRAILAGDTLTGVTIMRMEAGLDTGPMLATAELPIEPGDSAQTLHDRLAAMGARLIVDTLAHVAAGSATERPQPISGVTYAEKLSKAEAVIDWRGDALNIVRRVRAFNPWPVASTTLGDAPVRIWEADLAPGSRSEAGSPSAAAPGTIVAATPAGIDVACGTNVLRILKLQFAGRKALPAADVIHAVKLAGARLGTHGIRP